MHLAHTIPWNGISRHFEFIRENKAVYGSPSGIFAKKEEERTESDLLHFARVFADTVDEFAATERRKFPAKMDTTIPLFSDELLDNARFRLEPFNHNDNRSLPLNASLQQVSYWKTQGEAGFCTQHGDLADAVKFLIQQHQSAALLTLCQAVPLAGLFSLSWGHSFGVDLNACESFQIYVLLNLAYAVQQTELLNHKKAFRIFDFPALRRLVLSFFEDCDFSAQCISHRQFWEKYVVTSTYNSEDTIITDPAEVDAADLKKYLAKCFRDLYLYDMMLKETGSKSTKEFWINEFVFFMNAMFSPLSLPVP